MAIRTKEPGMIAFVIAVFIGGAIGTSVRALLALNIPQGSLHMATFAANMLACLLYAAVSTAVAVKMSTRASLSDRDSSDSKEQGSKAVSPSTSSHRISSYWTPLWSKGVTVGLCGGLSTMSTFAYEIVLGFHASAWYISLGYLLLSLVGGFLAIWLGIMLAKWVVRSDCEHA